MLSLDAGVSDICMSLPANTKAETRGDKCGDTPGGDPGELASAGWGAPTRPAARGCARGRPAPPTPHSRRRDHRGKKAQGASPASRRIQRNHLYLHKPHSWSKEWGP